MVGCLPAGVDGQPTQRTGFHVAFQKRVCPYRYNSWDARFPSRCWCRPAMRMRGQPRGTSCIRPHGKNVRCVSCRNGTSGRLHSRLTSSQPTLFLGHSPGVPSDTPIATSPEAIQAVLRLAPGRSANVPQRRERRRAVWSLPRAFSGVALLGCQR
jgi:hypothetical protein